MRVILQRIKRGSVSNLKETRTINQGYYLLVGFNKEDDISKLDYMIDKIINLRVFSDETGNLNLSILDVKGSILSISQFTLYADTNKGRRPSFDKVLGANLANDLYQEFNKRLIQKVPLEQGFFGEYMKIEVENDGPVTIILES